MKNFFVLFIASFFLLESCVQANENFDPDYSVGIVSAWTKLSEPHALAHYWTVSTHITFENGLKGYHEEKCYSQFSAYELANRPLPSGNVNILYTDTTEKGDFMSLVINYPSFKLEFESHPYSQTVILAVNYDYNYQDSLRIISITMDEIVTKSFIFKKHRYQYVYELSDGSVWTTDWIKNCYSEKSRKDFMKRPAIVLGNSKSGCIAAIQTTDRSEQKLLGFFIDSLERIR